MIFVKALRKTLELNEQKLLFLPGIIRQQRRRLRASSEEAFPYIFCRCLCAGLLTDATE